MNEQILLDYEPLKYLFERAHEELTMQNTKIFYPPTINYEATGTKSEYKDKMTERISRRDALQRAFEELLKEFQTVKQAYEKVIAVLDPAERNYCYHRYVLGMSNKQFSKAFNCPLEKVYKVRQALLFKIKDL